ncbi:MAG TPA: methionine aminotransferase [Chitinophagaceae bacterium]|nr:methionine aminotransferase [Chitinophagaceae bacterium]
MNPSITSKLPHTGTTIFTVMSALAAQHQAINLGQGFPDFPMDPALTRLVSQAMEEGFNQYAPMEGYLPLREALAEKAAFLYQASLDPRDMITMTPGGTYAIYTALTAMLQPGDEVILFEPAYDSYRPNILVNQAIPVTIQLQPPHYHIDWQEVRGRLTSRTRALILNSPANPTGAILSEEDIHELRSLVGEHPLLLVSDEVYEHLVFDGRLHQSLLRYPDLLQRSFVCFSFGKVFHCTGWKLGYCVAPPSLMAEFRKVHQFNCFSCHTPSQVAIARYLQDRHSYLDLAGLMQQKRDEFAAWMAATRFTPLPSHGSYFQCYSYERISDEPDREFAIRLTRDYGVASIPLSAFYHDAKDRRILRFCFAKQSATLREAAQRLSAL